MIRPLRFCGLLTSLILLLNTAWAQNAPIGAWESYLPYNNTIGLTIGGNTLYAICRQSFFSLNAGHENDLVTYSKTDGMSDIGMICAGYDEATSTLVLGYENGNIDLYKNNTFYNVPQLKQKVTGSDKKISQIYCDNGTAFIVTAIGIFAINIDRQAITQTIQVSTNKLAEKNITPAVTGFIHGGDYYYAATNNGLHRIKQDRLYSMQLYWENIDSLNGITNVVAVNNEVYFSSSKAVFKLINDTLQRVYIVRSLLGRRITHIDGGNDKLLISQYSDSTSSGLISVLGTDNKITDSFPAALAPLQAAELPDGTMWVADAENGLLKRTESFSSAPHYPAGPSSQYSYDIYTSNGDVYIAHGEYNQFFGANHTQYGVSYFHNNQWKLYTRSNYPIIGNVSDISVLAKDESRDILYAGSFFNGLVTIYPNDSIELFNNPLLFDPNFSYGPGYQQVAGLCVDKSNNLWLTIISANHTLYLKTEKNSWHKFKVPDVISGGQIISDDNGRIYFISGGEAQNGGIAVLDHRGTVADQTDDVSYHMKEGKGLGNLPSNFIYCLAKDHNNDIWIGSNDGIAIINKCQSPYTQTAPCDAVIPVADFGNGPEPLFHGMAVNSIAIDEIDRKWVGTNQGVWVLSPDGQKIIYRFTAANSPLPSDRVQKVAIDRSTGIAYFGTSQGLVSYRTAITAEGTSNKDAIIFPNPVPSGYTGSIAIKGLLTNSDIRITDINGQLVYRTKVQEGGQVIWDGKDYTGRRPQSGVYLVYIAGTDGKETHTGKIVFIQ